MFKLELELVEKFKENINNVFIPVKINEEVPFFSRNIDMVILNQNNEIISIEFKLNDIKGVLEQSLKCLLCSDYVYVCLPNKKIRKSTINRFKEYGIGLIVVDEKITILEEAKKSQKNFLKNKIRNYL